MRTVVVCLGLPLLFVVAVVACAPARTIPQATGACAGQEADVGAEASGELCGNLTAAGDVHVAAGETLTIQAGSVLALPEGKRIDVGGTLVLSGAPDAPVTVLSTARWGGVSVSGALNGAFARIVGEGAAISSTGEVSLNNVEVDLRQPITGPDCTSVNGGTFEVDHVRFTGCHCPFHINSADSVRVDGSILDGAANPMMIQRAGAEVHGSHLLAADVPFYDIGGDITADVSGNYYGGGAPNIRSDDATQFAGTDDFADAPIDGVGPDLPALEE